MAPNVGPSLSVPWAAGRDYFVPHAIIPKGKFVSIVVYSDKSCFDPWSGSCSDFLPKDSRINRFDRLFYCLPCRRGGRNFVPSNYSLIALMAYFVSIASLH